MPLSDFRATFRPKNRASSYSQGADDNEGLWTAEFAAAQCFRFLVTKQKAAYDIAFKNFVGMELLLNVTQVPGLLSRSIATDNQGDPSRWNLFNKTKYVPISKFIFWFLFRFTAKFLHL